MRNWYGFVVIAVFCSALFLGHDWLRLQYDANKAAKTAAPWLLSHQSEISDPGVIWVLAKINQDYCGNDQGTAKLLGEMFDQFNKDHTLLAYRRLLDKDFQYNVSTTSLTDQTTHFDNVLIPALYCDKQPALTESTYKRVMELSGGQKYQVSHALLALTWLKERNCLAKDQSDYISNVTERLRTQQNQTTEFGDLFAERTAFLQYAEPIKKVPDAWLRTIVDNQQSSGGWKTSQDAYIFGTNENTHTTALSLFALTQFTHSCPF